MAITALLAACSSKEEEENNTSEPIATSEPEGLDDAQTVIGFEEDEDGNVVPVEYESNKAYVLDNDGRRTGVTVPAKNYTQSSASGSSQGTNTGKPAVEKPVLKGEDDINNKTEDAKNTTSAELTTLPTDKDVVPKTTDSGKSVQFSDKDIAAITNMLEVPNLYVESFENGQRLPINVATHVALWMEQKNDMAVGPFAGNNIALDLFKYYAQTVVEFKTKCNSEGANSNISYNTSSDTFTISSYEQQTHTIQITDIQELGNNNYYKVTATVKKANGSDCSYKKVVAVVQKNKLDLDLGFSIKALQWS